MRIAFEAENCAGQVEDAAGGPGLRYVGAEILDREAAGLATNAAVKFRQAIKDEVARRLAYIACDHGGFFRKPVSAKTHSDDAVVVRPHVSVLIRERVVGRVLR